MAKTSFLIPVRNGEKTIRAALESVLSQSDSNFEIVLVDDGSTDDTAKIATQISDPRLRVFSTEAKGLVHALNFGLAQCSGKYIARMDGDDIATRDRLALQIPLLNEDPSCAVVDGQVEFFRDDGPVLPGMTQYAHWINHILEPEDFDRAFLIESPVVHPAATFRKKQVLALGGYRDGPFPEDYDLWARIHAHGGRFRKIPHCLVRMRDRPDRLTRTDSRYNAAGFRTVRQSLLGKTHLQSPKDVVFWGAGKELRPWLRWLLSHGHCVKAIIDIDPKKIGRFRQGIEICSPDILESMNADVLLAGVRVRGARNHIRLALRTLRPKWKEGVDWWAIC